MEVQFYLDDVDNEIDVEVTEGVEIFDEETLYTILNKIMNSNWFVQGNKTEGILTFEDKSNLSIDWKSITMGEDWDSDEEDDHEIKLSIVWNEDQTDVELVVV